MVLDDIRQRWSIIFLSLFSTILTIKYPLPTHICFLFPLIRTVFIVWCSIRTYSVWFSGGRYSLKIVYQNLLHLSFCCSHYFVIQLSLGFPAVSYHFCLRYYCKICCMWLQVFIIANDKKLIPFISIRDFHFIHCLL